MMKRIIPRTTTPIINPIKKKIDPERPDDSSRGEHIEFFKVKPSKQPVQVDPEMQVEHPEEHFNVIGTLLS